MRKRADCEALSKKWATRDLGPFKLYKVEAVNYRPHPFTIGPRHVGYASDHCGGMIGADVCEKIPCAANGCGLPLSEHTHDVVMMLQLTRNVSKDEAQAALKAVCDEVEADGIDGFTFVETPEKYRML